jgi:hypothetical protein
MTDRLQTPGTRRRALTLAVGAALAAGCASSGPQRPEAAPAVVAAVDAQMRLVASETTWVSLGVGYQIVALSKRDIADVDSSVVHQSKMYNLVFGEYPQEVIVLVTRVSYDRNGYEQAPTPLLPPGTVQQTVDIRLYDGSPPNTAQSQPQGRGRGGRGGYGGRGGAPATATTGARGTDAPGGPGADPTEAVTRAWLSARGTKLTGQFSSVGANGIQSDPRVPVWAESMVPALALDDTTTDRLATELASQPTSVYPLREFFTMARPGTGANAGRGAPGGGVGGGMRGGGRGRQGGGTGGQVLTGNALFVAQATVLGKYLTVRQGSPLIGQLVDGQIRGKRVTDVLAAQPSGPKDVESLDTDWRDWLRQYGPH